MALYKNKNGTGERTCKCGSWKQHWINYSSYSWPSSCQVSGCNDPASVGAHLRRLSDNKEFIAPLCSACNNRTDNFYLKSDSMIVSADRGKTCGY